MTTPTAPAPTAHHPLGPSKWPAWEECPCFESDQELADEEGSDASRGQAMHAALAKCLRGDPLPFDGLDQAEEDQVRWMATTVVEFAASMGYAASEIRVEQRITMYKADSFEVLYFGTMDIEFGPFIIDAKTGDERNYFPQLVGYGLAKMERDDLPKVYLGCLYGRLKRFRRYVLDRWTAETIAYGILAKHANPRKTPRACSYCGMCKNKATCSAITPQVDAVCAGREDWAMRLPTMHVSQAGADPVTLGAMRWLWKAYIEPWGAGVEYATNSLAENGVTPLGFRKQDEKGRLDYHNPAGVFDAMLAAGIPLDALKAAVSFSMKPLAAAYAAQFGCSQATAAVKVEELLVKAGVARRGDASFKLIRKSDAEDEIRAALARPAQPLPLQ